jgi:glutathione S-transferase
MITVHHLDNSRSQRVLWLLEELGLPYHIESYRRDPKTMLAPRALLKVHPLGKSPVITDGDVTVAETGAIVEYLVDGPGSGRLKPVPGSAEHRRYLYWLHFAEGSAMPPLLVKLIFDQVRNAKVPFFVKPIVKGIADKVGSAFIQPNLERQFAFMENELAERDWFAGDEFSAADVMMSFPLEAGAARAGLDARFPRLQGWLQRAHARPAYRRALDRGGPYSVLG